MSWGASPSPWRLEATSRVAWGLPAWMVAELQERAKAQGVTLEEVVADLLEAGLPEVLAEAARVGLAAAVGRARSVDVKESALVVSHQGAPDHAITAQPSSSQPTASRGLPRAVGGDGV